MHLNKTRTRTYQIRASLKEILQTIAIVQMGIHATIHVPNDQRHLLAGINQNGKIAATEIDVDYLVDVRCTLADIMH